jgi:hypothetical protein
MLKGSFFPGSDDSGTLTFLFVKYLSSILYGCRAPDVRSSVMRQTRPSSRGMGLISPSRAAPIASSSSLEMVSIVSGRLPLPLYRGTGERFGVTESFDVDDPVCAGFAGSAGSGNSGEFSSATGVLPRSCILIAPLSWADDGSPSGPSLTLIFVSVMAATWTERAMRRISPTGYFVWGRKRKQAAELSLPASLAGR